MVERDTEPLIDLGPAFDTWVTNLIAYVKAGPQGEMWKDVVFALTRQQELLTAATLRAETAEKERDREAELRRRAEAHVQSPL